MSGRPGLEASSHLVSPGPPRWLLAWPGLGDLGTMAPEAPTGCPARHSLEGEGRHGHVGLGPGGHTEVSAQVGLTPGCGRSSTLLPDPSPFLYTPFFPWGHPGVVTLVSKVFKAWCAVYSRHCLASSVPQSPHQDTSAAGAKGLAALGTVLEPPARPPEVQCRGVGPEEEGVGTLPDSPA